MKEFIKSLVPQNHPKLNENIRKWGCRFRSLQAIAEIRLKKALTVDQINDLYKVAIQDPKTMKPNCECGSMEHRIINGAFKVLGSSLTGAQIGNQKGNVSSFFNGVMRGVDGCIDRWTTSTGFHFVYHTIEGEIFNPWSKEYDKGLDLKMMTEKLLYRIKEL